MAVMRWSRGEALDPSPFAVDELDGVDVLLLDNVGAADGDQLEWCRRAPCVVVGASTGAPSSAVDVAVADLDGETASSVVAACEQNPQASKTLVDVLRIVEHLDVTGGLVVESLAYSMLLGGSEFREWFGTQKPRDKQFSSGPPVLVERDGDVLHLILDRPESRNAFSAEMRDALVEALALAEVDDSIERIEISANGPSFCSGGHLAEFGSSADMVRAHEIRSLRHVGSAIARIADRVTVQVHGSCVGAGVEVPAFAGRVVADADTTFRLPEVRMGLIPGAGGTVSVVRRVGRQAATRMALVGEAIDAPEALSLGLIDEIL